MEKTKNILLKRPWVTGVVVIVAALGLWYFTRSNQPETIDYVVVERGTVAQLVSVTGIVKAASEVDLSFEKGGKITGVFHGVGERVGAGSALVSIGSGELSAQIAQAEADVKAQQAKLAELERGARPEDIAVSEVDVENAKNDVVNSIQSAYLNADDAMRNKVDQLFSNPRSDSPTFNFNLSDSKLKNKLETERVLIETLLRSWNTEISNSIVEVDVEPYITLTKNNLATVQSFLDEVAFAVNSLQSSTLLTQTTLDAYRAAILAGRTNVSNAIDSIVSEQETLRTAVSKLALKKAGTSKEEIDAQAARVASVEASVLNLKAQLAKTVIYSPISGIVTKQDAKLGEIATAGTVLTSIISDAKYQIEANVAEADIAKIKIGDDARVTLDAYGSDVVFGARVTKIDPAETIIDGVPTYKTTLQFVQNDARIRSGMTANTDIAGQKRETVLFIPGRAVLGKGTDKTVALVGGATTTEVKIETGLRGSNGDVEVISGLNEGDRIKASQ
ncbi:MAG: efflux RND transporter periplasmic adaptor subunit [bacterium]|nr:efflux RND transporter periplasmic adaptor subunit [bacterium]